MKITKLGIVILSYNTKDLLSDCLASIVKSHLSTSEKLLSRFKVKVFLSLVVVDNNSKDGSAGFVKEFAKKNNSEAFGLEIIVLENKRNEGFAAGNNIGLRHAVSLGCSFAMVLNSDTYCQNAFWLPMLHYLYKHARCGVIGPKIYFASGREYHKECYQKEDLGRVIWSAGGMIDWKNVFGKNIGVNEVDKGQHDTAKKVDLVSGCCLLARSDVWRKTGYFDERYFMYYEDADFCLKARSLGYSVAYSPDGKIWHVNAGSSKVGGNLHDYFISRNRLVFGMKWAPLRSKIALLRESARLMVNGRPWQRIGIRDYYLRRLGKGSWAE